MTACSNARMSRDHKKLRVFALADQIALDMYRSTATFPVAERYALQTQIRRSAVSTAANIVEGCARDTTKDYKHFLTIALGSASEARYLLGLAHRLGFVPKGTAEPLEARCGELVRSLQKLVTSVGD
jgi:four helix bundle protein